MNTLFVLFLEVFFSFIPCGTCKLLQPGPSDESLGYCRVVLHRTEMVLRFIGPGDESPGYFRVVPGGTQQGDTDIKDQARRRLGPKQ